MSHPGPRNTMGVTCGEGLAYRSGPPKCAPCFHLFQWVRIILVKLQVFTFIVSGCDVHYDLHVKKLCSIRLDYSLFCRGSCFNCYLYLFTCPSWFQYQMTFMFLHNTTVSRVEQELVTLPEHLCSPLILSWDLLLDR